MRAATACRWTAVPPTLGTTACSGVVSHERRRRPIRVGALSGVCRSVPNLELTGEHVNVVAGVHVRAQARPANAPLLTLLKDSCLEAAVRGLESAGRAGSSLLPAALGARAPRARALAAGAQRSVLCALRGPLTKLKLLCARKPDRPCLCLSPPSASVVEPSTAALTAVQRAPDR